MEQFEVGEWRVQPSLNRLSRNGDEVRLEPKVMQVLEALAETPGEVVNREQLVARVWPGVFVTDDVLHRAIRELRRVFGDDTASPTYVETIRKRGYRLIAPVRRVEVEPKAPPV
ncbi:MAG TPA: transcriptional regulator, partial [Vicinamibacterales bacterium]|nr:transcriptional regulator [Vicinamibacterales bacterium]